MFFFFHQCHVPYLVPSKLSKVRGGFFIPSVSSFAKAAMKCIGQGEQTVLVHWRHALQDFLLLTLLPRPVFMAVSLSPYFITRSCLTLLDANIMFSLYLF